MELKLLKYPATKLLGVYTVEGETSSKCYEHVFHSMKPLKTLKFATILKKLSWYFTAAKKLAIREGNNISSLPYTEAVKWAETHGYSTIQGPTFINKVELETLSLLYDLRESLLSRTVSIKERILSRKNWEFKDIWFHFRGLNGYELEPVRLLYEKNKIQFIITRHHWTRFFFWDPVIPVLDVDPFWITIAVFPRQVIYPESMLSDTFADGVCFTYINYASRDSEEYRKTMWYLPAGRILSEPRAIARTVSWKIFSSQPYKEVVIQKEIHSIKKYPLIPLNILPGEKYYDKYVLWHSPDIYDIIDTIYSKKSFLGGPVWFTKKLSRYCGNYY